MPLACDVFSALDTFLLTLPMFILTALAIHMFTRLPSPQFSDPSHPHNRQEIKVYGGRISGNKYTPALNTRYITQYTSIHTNIYIYKICMPAKLNNYHH